MPKANKSEFYFCFTIMNSSKKKKKSRKISIWKADDSCGKAGAFYVCLLVNQPQHFLQLLQAKLCQKKQNQDWLQGKQLLGTNVGITYFWIVLLEILKYSALFRTWSLFVIFVQKQWEINLLLTQLVFTRWRWRKPCLEVFRRHTSVVTRFNSLNTNQNSLIVHSFLLKLQQEPWQKK